MDDRVRGLGATLKRFLYIPIGILVATFVLGYLFSAARPATYQASTKLIFATSKEFDPLNLSQSYDVQRFVSNQAELITSPAVLRAAQVKFRTPQPTVDDLATRVQATAQKDGGIVIVTGTGGTGQEAADVVNNVTSAYSEYIRSSNSAMVSSLPATTDAATLAEVRDKAALYGDGLSQKDNATAPDSPIVPQPLRDAVFLSLFCTLAALAVITAMHLRRPRVRGARAISEQLGVPIIAVTHRTDGRPRAEAQLRKGMAAVHAAGSGSALVLAVVTPDAPAAVDTATKRLATAMTATEPAVAIHSLDDIEELGHDLRRTAAVNLIAARNITDDYRIIALGREADGLIVVTRGIADIVPLEETKRVAGQAGLPIVGVVVDDYDGDAAGRHADEERGHSVADAVRSAQSRRRPDVPVPASSSASPSASPGGR